MKKGGGLTVATRIAVPPLCLPRGRSYSSGSFGVYSVDAETSGDTPVRIRRGCLTGRGDTSELLVKGVQLGRNVLTDEGVEDDLEQRPMPEYPEQLDPGPTDVGARFLGPYRHLEHVVDVHVGGLPFRRVHELISFDVVQVRPVAGHLQPVHRAQPFQISPPIPIRSTLRNRANDNRENQLFATSLLSPGSVEIFLNSNVSIRALNFFLIEREL